MVFVLAFIIFFLYLVNYYNYLVIILPTPNNEYMHSMPQSSMIYDRNGELLYEIYGDVRRTEVPLYEMPEILLEATIAAEDKRFYSHSGFDIFGIIRAFYKNVRDGEITQGASTITQQVARTIFLSQEKSYDRKIKELVLAVELEKRYSKSQILEYYLNNIPYGSNTYGVEAASKYYFNKSVKDLNPREAIYLSALPKAPSDYNPLATTTDKLVERAESIIDDMYKLDFINDFERKNYKVRGKPSFIDSPIEINAPHFVFYVLDELYAKYSEKKIKESGFKIYTSLDMKLQETAKEIVDEYGELNEEKYNADNAALIALNPKNGEILSMVGSRDYFESGDGAFNVVTSQRQPGSSFKPYVYAAAIKNGMTPNTVLIDSRTNFASYNNGVEYIPQNYDGKYRGAVTVRKALAGSLNIPAVKALVNTGLDNVLDLTKQMGIDSLSERTGLGPSLALGGGDISLLEHAKAMSVFANSGEKQEITSILKVLNADDEIIFKKEAKKGQQVLEPDVAYWINDMLSDTIARRYIFGYKNLLEIAEHQVAAKTGTSQDYRDAWTIGYTSDFVVGVWAGNNDYTPMKNGSYGLAVAGPIWHDFFQVALSKTNKQKFAKPDGLKELPPPIYPLVKKLRATSTEIVSSKSTVLAF